MTIFSVRWLLDATERALKSFAQGALGVFGQDWIGIDYVQANVGRSLIAGATMAVLSILTSIASSRAQGISPASIAPPV